MKIVKKIAAKILMFFGLKKKVENTLSALKKNIEIKYNWLFNETVKKQNIDIKSIPIIIISFNQFYYLKRLIEFLRKHDYTNIVIIDNHSTFPPLLNYFDEIEKYVTIHKLDENFGHLVFWRHKELFDKYSKGYYVVTDPDINPIEECPGDFLKFFKKKLDRNYKITKVGFSLKIDDIPETNTNKDKILSWESKFYQIKDKTNGFIADIDTTFALYRPKYEFHNENFYHAIRMEYPYTARHGGWYIDNRNLTEEQKFYFENCNDSSSWRIDEQGKIIKKMYN